MATTKAGEKILDEDEFAESVRKIIERDFYPDLSRLRNQLDWMQALENEDAVALRAVRARMAASSARRARATPGATPAWAAAGSATPAAGSATPSAGAGAGGGGGAGSAPDPTADLSLDEFLDRHTSEDNAAFSKLMEKQREEHRRRYWWLFGDPNPNPGVTSGPGSGQLLLTNGEDDEPDRRARPSLMIKGNPAQNSLMNPPQISWAPQDVHMPGQPRVTDKSNTRLASAAASSSLTALAATPAAAPASQFKAPLPLATPRPATLPGLGGSEGADSLPRDRQGRVDLAALVDAQSSRSMSAAASLDAALADPFDDFRLGGASFLAAPSPLPGVDASPIMTYGNIASTPLRLDPLDTPLDMRPSSGPQFNVAQPSHRDRIAHELTGAAHAKRQAQKRAAELNNLAKRRLLELAASTSASSSSSSLSSLSSSSSHDAAGTQPSSTPSNKRTSVTAGLASPLIRTPSSRGLASQLRATYGGRTPSRSGSSVRSQPSSAASTPVARPVVVVTTPRSSAAAGPGAAAARASAGSSSAASSVPSASSSSATLTDDLLML